MPNVPPKLALTAPAAERNRQPILDVLARVVPAGAFVLELASGTGQHAAFCAPRLPDVTWQPSDLDPTALTSIDAWRAEAEPHVRPAVGLDIASDDWPVDAADVVVAINVIHISPWEVTEGLVRGAGRVLSPGGVLYTYGPYKRGGAHTAESNERFDRSLRARDPRWGVRDVDDVAAAAREAGLELADVVRMPANNLSLIFRKAPG